MAKWLRVNKQNPCVVCGKFDWDTYCPELGWACCMRVVSNRPAKNGGYIHPIDGAAVKAPHYEPPPTPTIDAAAMMKRWHAETTLSQYGELGETLGVSPEALLALKCAYAPEYRAWAFAMRNGSGEVVGIRLRAMDGHKWSVRGGREGIFIPKSAPDQTVWCVEGPTNCAASLSLGKFTIGRPNCSGGIAHLAAVISRMKIRRAVVIGDNDPDKLRPNGDRWNPGLDGANRLAEEIGVPCCVLVLPCKDSRDFLQLGGTTELLDSLLQGLVWSHPQKKAGISTAQNLTTILYSGENLSSTFAFH